MLKLLSLLLVTSASIANAYEKIQLPKALIITGKGNCNMTVLGLDCDQKLSFQNNDNIDALIVTLHGEEPCEDTKEKFIHFIRDSENNSLQSLDVSGEVELELENTCQAFLNPQTFNVAIAGDAIVTYDRKKKANPFIIDQFSLNASGNASFNGRPRTNYTKISASGNAKVKGVRVYEDLKILSSGHASVYITKRKFTTYESRHKDNATVKFKLIDHDKY